MVYKCKMCGGDLNIEEGSKICVCEYCGSKQTVPAADNDKKMKLFERANRLRFNCEFDKASTVYESIIDEFPGEAEAYWGNILCKYGIEYVNDPADGHKVPTCHRSSFDSVMDDPDFDMVMETADVTARGVYREQAKQLEELRKGIVEVSSKEEPYDIFICYKETDVLGERTVDSVIAQDVYDTLTEKGYRVFFSRISLEDKLGTEYEPYIFAALNSAKIMLAFGTSYDYYNAVWVKNEWSRFLHLMAKDKDKHLIPCFKDIDAYDIPKEFAKLQAQDMGKVGAIQDLIRGIDKLMGRYEHAQTSNPDTGVQQAPNGPNANALLKRGYMALEDSAWDKAKEFFDQVLNMDAECSDAYLGLAMAEQEWRNTASMEESIENPLSRVCLDEIKNYQYAVQFSSGEKHDYLERLKETEEQVKNENKELLSAARKKVKKNIIAVNKEWIFGVCSDGSVATVKRGDLFKLDSYDISSWNNIIAVFTAERHVVGLRSDGTVVATGCNDHEQCDVSNWTNIVMIVTDDTHTLGLRSDGTVVATGYNDYGQCNVSNWTDIVAIAAGDMCSLGLRSDGTVVATGLNNLGQCDVSNWTNIKAIAASSTFSVGLRSDGTVVATGYNRFGQCDVSNWTDIIAIANEKKYIVGLRSDGTVVAAGYNDYGQCNVSDWTGIVTIATGGDKTIGLRLDGTVVATGFNSCGECDVSDWTDIIAIAANGDFAGVCSDGTVVVAGHNVEERFNVLGLKLFYADNEKDAIYNKGIELMEQATEESLHNAAGIFGKLKEYKDSEALRDKCDSKVFQIEQERLKKEHDRHVNQLRKEKGELTEELESLHGFFSGKRRREIEDRLKEIDVELN